MPQRASDMRIEYLSYKAKPQVVALLDQNALLNVYQYTVLSDDYFRRGQHVGVWVGGKLSAVAYVYGGRYLVPFSPDPKLGRDLGEFLSSREYQPMIVLGGRKTTDEVIEGARWSYAHRFDHVQQVCTEVEETASLNIRPARMSDLPEVVFNAARMNEEDIRIDPLQFDPNGFHSAVSDSVREGCLWVAEEKDKIVFQVTVSYTLPWACHVGSVWVPPSERGKGYATRGMASVCRELLPKYKKIVLEVREDNLVAVSCYKKVGFKTLEPLRMSVKPTI